MSAVIKFEQEGQKPGGGILRFKKMIYISLIVGLNVAAIIITVRIFKPRTPTRSATPPPAVSGPAAPAPTTVPAVRPSAQTIFGSYESFQQFIDQLISDLSILNDPKYQLLKSLGVKVPVVKSGRENPFVPY